MYQVCLVHKNQPSSNATVFCIVPSSPWKEVGPGIVSLTVTSTGDFRNTFRGIVDAPPASARAIHQLVQTLAVATVKCAEASFLIHIDSHIAAYQRGERWTTCARYIYTLVRQQHWCTVSPASRRSCCFSKRNVYRRKSRRNYAYGLCFSEVQVLLFFR